MKKIIALICSALIRYSVTLPHELRSFGLTVIDTGTGLQWVKDPSQFGSMDWDSARNFVETLEFEGHSDWRLPSGLNPDGTLFNSQPHGANCPDTELGHLYHLHFKEPPAGEMAPFENFGNKRYWTGTEFPDDSTKAMLQDFIDGGNNPWNKSATRAVWPVRKADAMRQYIPTIGWVIFIAITIAIATWRGLRRRKKI